MIFSEIALAGALGTAVMMAVMSFIHAMKWANADMVRAIGSLFTRSKVDAFWPGILLHFIAGIAFAFPYAFFVGYAPGLGPFGVFILAGLFGLVHGIWVALLLVVEVAEHHPLPEFRETGLGVAVSHCIGHFFYGLTVGLTLALNWEATQTAIRGFHLGAAFADFVGYSVMWGPLFGIPIAFFAYLTYLGLTATDRARKKS